MKKKEFVQCGVSTGIPGFSNADSKGKWQGIDVNLCRAIAVTMFGDSTKFKVTPLNTQQCFTALQSGEVDVLTRNTKVTLTYVEIMRNVPLLLQLFFWYALITENMPGPRQAVNPLPGLFISNLGLKAPSLVGDSLDWMLIGLALAIVLILVLGHWARKRKETTGREFALGRVGVALLIGLPIAAWLLSGVSLTLDMPEIRGFNFVGGLTLSLKFATLLAGFVIYTSAFIAEVVRSGIQAVSQGQ